MASVTVAISGASGAIYGLTLIAELLKRGDDVILIISPSGFLLLKAEVGLDLADSTPKEIVSTILSYAEKALEERPKGTLKYFPSDDLTALVASGSALKKLMVVVPCSMGTLARIAVGASTNLIERAADCILKEGGELVLVPRETPLSPIHLENMLKLARIGVKILPAMPAFYMQPKTIGDMVNFVVGKTLDALGIENSLYKRWDGEVE
ncbi:MAG: UbiX family flavin prenyltransferase [Deltaproteobacteria bacterium]|nr:UbiX family flavin prenyltransferase [Deltaproteobacteria bacterium]